MWNFRSPKLRLAKVLCAGTVILVAVGCGAGPQAYDQDTINKATTRAQTARAIFNKVNGDYSSISPQDKAELLKLSNNSEEDVKKLWNAMAHPPGGGPTMTPPK